MLLLLCVSVSRPDGAVIWQLTLTDLTGLPNKYTSCILREGVYNYLKWGFLRYFILELLIRHHVTQALYKRPHARVSLSLVTLGIHWVLYSLVTLGIHWVLYSCYSCFYSAHSRDRYSWTTLTSSSFLHLYILSPCNLRSIILLFYESKEKYVDFVFNHYKPGTLHL